MAIILRCRINTSNIRPSTVIFSMRLIPIVGGTGIDFERYGQF